MCEHSIVWGLGDLWYPNSEISSVLSYINVYLQAQSLTQVDTNRNGAVDLEEFMMIMQGGASGRVVDNRYATCSVQRATCNVYNVETTY